MAKTNLFPQPPIRQHDQTSAGSLPVVTVPELAIFRTVDERGEKKSAALRQHIDEPPAPVFGTVVAFPGQTDRPLRREWLTELEVEQLCAEARKRGRYGHRDGTMILIAFRHGLRVSELVALRWQQVDLDAGRLRVIRRKVSGDSVQPLSGPEIRALRRIKREQEPGTRYVFVTERKAPMTTSGFDKMPTAHCGAHWDGWRILPSSPPRLRLQACQSRRRHPLAGGLSRTRKPDQYPPLHEDGRQAVRQVLEGLAALPLGSLSKVGPPKIDGEGPCSRHTRIGEAPAASRSTTAIGTDSPRLTKFQCRPAEPAGHRRHLPVQADARAHRRGWLLILSIPPACAVRA